jgi:hypothetical protein
MLSASISFFYQKKQLVKYKFTLLWQLQNLK